MDFMFVSRSATFYSFSICLLFCSIVLFGSCSNCLSSIFVSLNDILPFLSIVSTMLDKKDRDYITKNNICFENTALDTKPIYSFNSDQRLHHLLRTKLGNLKYITPTPIQAVSIPLILDNNDFIGISQTGSGKTLAFLVPLITKLLNENPSSDDFVCSPKVLVITPTRELALQIDEVVNKFDLFASVCVYGRAPRYEQISMIKKLKPQIIIGTPGRLNDFIDSNVISLEKTNYLVLDEADSMFDMGFYPQISTIIDACPPANGRQTLLFSATWESKIESLVKPFLRPDPIFVSIGGNKLNACVDIKQHLFFVDERQKLNLLKQILSAFNGYKILVFTNTKRKTEEIYNEFSNDSKFAFMHGDLAQTQRIRAVKGFNSGKLLVIFATDVASRGLDINDISVVVNYDTPSNAETYVHRIGRSGRMGKKGISFTFITKHIFTMPQTQKKLVSVLKESGNSVPSFLIE